MSEPKKFKRRPSKKTKDSAPKTIAEAELVMGEIRLVLSEVDTAPDGDLTVKQWGRVSLLADAIRIWAVRQKHRREAGLKR